MLLFALNSFGALFLIIIGITINIKKKDKGGLLFLIFCIGSGTYQLLAIIAEAGYENLSVELINLLTTSGAVAAITTAPLFFFSVLFLMDSAYEFKPVHLLLVIPMIPALLSAVILGVAGEYGKFFFIEQPVFKNSLFLTFHFIYMTGYITVIILLMALLAGRIDRKERFPVIIILFICFILILGRDISDFNGLYNIAAILMTSAVLFLYIVITINPSFIILFSKQVSSQHYRKSRLTGLDINQLKNTLDNHIVENHPYLNSELNNKTLAMEIGLTSVQLSELLNLHYNLNFNQYINNLRIQYAVKLVKSNRDLSVLDIAFECGFNSSSAFYSAYRRITGSSPRK
ncbi:MAG: AraC family transcriptional regulator [Deltaproteobacteria bacterium]|nr:AraC family transcriptional regulator [Deltaproteobacteria bacterium]